MTNAKENIKLIETTIKNNQIKIEPLGTLSSNTINKIKNQLNPQIKFTGNISKEQIINSVSSSNIIDINKHLYFALDDYTSLINKFAYLMEICYLTKEIIELVKFFDNNNYLTGINKFLDTFNKDEISAPNLSCLKLNNIMQEISEGNLPSNIPTAINELNVPTAEKLAKDNHISLNRNKRGFFVDEDPESLITIREANVSLSSLDLLEGINESEILNFLNYLSEHNSLGSNHSIGKKILDIIKSWSPYMSFDKDSYYHGRHLKKGVCPYTDSVMGTAPSGITWHGRYNFPGASYYYFSDKVEGAQKEIKKHHSPIERIQVAEVKPTRAIKMIDLSEEKKGSKFLEYCRFPLERKDNSIIRREYLIPSFVSDCCKAANIEGIKYYGSTSYTNYVTWHNGFFKTIKHAIYEPPFD